MECLRSITSLVHRHLPKQRPSLRSAQNRIREVRFADSPVVQLRKNTRRNSGDVGSIPIGRALAVCKHFRRAVEFGLSVKRETASAFKPRTIGQPMDSQLASCPSFSFFGWAAVLWLSNCVAQMRESVSCKREDTGSSPVQKHRSRLLSILHHFRRVAGLGYRSSRRGRRFESGLRNQMPE
jgi:hypothetical protein